MAVARSVPRDYLFSISFYIGKWSDEIVKEIQREILGGFETQSELKAFRSQGMFRDWNFNFFGGVVTSLWDMKRKDEQRMSKTAEMGDAQEYE